MLCAAKEGMTSDSSQGQTADRVLIHVDTELGAKDLLNSRMAYVSVSRGAHDAQLFTNDREKLPAALGHDVSQQSAHVTEIEPNQTIAPQQELSQDQQRGHGIVSESAFKTLPAPDNCSVTRAQTLSRST
jgi:ATP-dependent exoDNAse (exonuclease V) alpha subunit